MIYYDRETAKEFREKAREELVKYTTHIIKSMYTLVPEEKQISETEMESIARSYVEMRLPRLISTLLNKSGIIFPKNRENDPDNPIALYFDNASESDDYNDMQSDLVQHGMNGGIILDDGSIHT